MAQQFLTNLIILVMFAGAAGLSLHYKNDSCVCLNWKATYADKKIPCGVGSEFFFMTGETTPSKEAIHRAQNTPNMQGADFIKGNRDDMFCKEFFETLDFNTCVNINIGHDEGTWCYVDSHCKNLNVGQKVPGYDVSWKKCSAGSDRTFRNFTPEALFNFSKQNDIDMTVLDKLAYPGHRGGEEQIQLIHTYDFKEGTVPGQVGMLINTSEPIFFDTHPDGHTPHVILHRGKAYRVDSVSKSERDETHPGTWSTFRCMSGC